MNASTERENPILSGNHSLPGGHAILLRPSGESERVALTARYLLDGSPVCVFFDCLRSDGAPANQQWLKTHHNAVDLGPLELFCLCPERSELFEALRVQAAASPSPLASNALILCKALWSLRSAAERSDGSEIAEEARYALSSALLDNEMARRRIESAQEEAWTARLNPLR